MEYFLKRQSFLSGSDSEGDQDEIVPDREQFTEEDIVIVDEEQQNEDNVNMLASPHNDGEIPDSDDEGNVSGPSHPRSSRRFQSSDDEGTVEKDLTIECDYVVSE